MFFVWLSVYTLVGLGVLYLFFAIRALSTARRLEALPPRPCEHRYMQIKYTLHPDGRSSGQAFCANEACRQPVNLDVVVSGGSPFDAGLGVLYTGPLTRPPEPPEAEPTEQVMVARKDLEKMLTDLREAFPPKNCGACLLGFEGIPNPEGGTVCHSCLERARVRGELSFLEDALTGYLRA